MSASQLYMDLNPLGTIIKRVGSSETRVDEAPCQLAEDLIDVLGRPGCGLWTTYY